VLNLCVKICRISEISHLTHNLGAKIGHSLRCVALSVTAIFRRCRICAVCNLILEICRCVYLVFFNVWKSPRISALFFRAFKAAEDCLPRRCLWKCDQTKKATESGRWPYIFRYFRDFRDFRVLKARYQRCRNIARDSWIFPRLSEIWCVKWRCAVFAEDLRISRCRCKGCRRLRAIPWSHALFEPS